MREVNLLIIHIFKGFEEFLSPNILRESLDELEHFLIRGI